MMSIEDLDKNVNVNFRVPLAYREALKAKAAEQGINLSKFFRNCMDEALKKDKETLSIPIDYLDAPDEKIFSLRVSRKKLEDFQHLFSSRGRDAGKIIRAFVYSTLPDSALGVTDSLFYLVIFLSNALHDKGFVLTSLQDIQKKKVTDMYPLIQEEKQGKDILVKVFDSTNHVLYTIPFHKI